MVVRRLLIVLGVLLVSTGPVAPAVTAAASFDSQVEARVLGLINEGRRRNGRANLAAHDGLRRVAREHSVNMSRRGSISHDGFRGRITRAGFTGSYAACENVAMFRPRGTASTETVAKKFYSLWLNSRPHRRCMFDASNRRYNQAGVGIYRDNSGRWWATLELARQGAARRRAA